MYGLSIFPMLNDALVEGLLSAVLVLAGDVPLPTSHMRFLSQSVDFDSSSHFSLPASSHPHIAQSNRRASPTPPAPRPRVHIRRNARQRRHAFTRRALPRGYLRRNQRACSPRNPGTRLKHSTWSCSALQVSALCSPPAVSLTTHSSSSAAFWTILAVCVPATLSGAIRQYSQCFSLVQIYSRTLLPPV
jgi:hypothetical protein